MSPFQALYGYPSPPVIAYSPGSTAVHVVDTALIDRDQLLNTLKSNIQMAQNRMKVYADKHRTERHFNVGDYVYLRLQSYRQHSVIFRQNHKLSPRFYDPYKIAARVGQVAYRLELPTNNKIHPVFHVSLLKLKLGTTSTASTQLSPMSSSGAQTWKPEAIL
ncbi:hypothetical protein L3X38_031862 [Prunus dulcis]|uniref:Tf2-1-like SH3-like domain-containing protein n=1 Tax=Prunus dulcis TaxID=3755 RepID=A0AAD4VCZ1_PRUDU|nr:hypothetical protein L3X38_031862 [Prunus dulcis]